MKIEMIEIVDYSVEPEQVYARVYWSRARGLTCDHPAFARNRAREGIAVPPDGRRVFPGEGDGREFFDSLQFGFCGLLRAQEPVAVATQPGTPFPPAQR